MVLAFLRILALIGLTSYIVFTLRRFYRFRAGRAKEVTDPYVVLGVSHGASDTELKEAYHRELAKYHPDKVAHLGEDLQRLARVKTTEIITAYQSLIRRPQ